MGKGSFMKKFLVSVVIYKYKVKKFVKYIYNLLLGKFG